ncbi:hypothetical protein GOP47_0015269 [Adiantum capillus-veneris]|uniref:Uncharacterized protein n=1 Tax=Adiantum capillus-veneris TaxID=13818 RepID=A0A9D4UJC5_ADICA|nr:hypothetical protein GOP47_0015269 [Adiantum capillus-veneris]
MPASCSLACVSSKPRVLPWLPTRFTSFLAPSLSVSPSLFPSAGSCQLSGVAASYQLTLSTHNFTNALACNGKASLSPMQRIGLGRAMAEGLLKKGVLLGNALVDMPHEHGCNMPNRRPHEHGFNTSGWEGHLKLVAHLGILVQLLHVSNEDIYITIFMRPRSFLLLWMLVIEDNDLLKILVVHPIMPTKEAELCTCVPQTQRILPRCAAQYRATSAHHLIHRWPQQQCQMGVRCL